MPPLRWDRTGASEMTNKKDKKAEQDKKIKEDIKKEGDSVEPKDKNALANIRKRTGAGKEGNGHG
jgi:hypothetical protein